MHSVSIAKVGLDCSLKNAFLSTSIELAVSLNSKDVQLYSRRDQEWIPTEVLSEVRD